MNTTDEMTSFDFGGYQVVRGEFFAHICEPSFTFNNYKVFVNMACLRKLPDTEFIQILVNPTDKMLAVRPCIEDEKDSFRWCSSKKHTPKHITARMFFAKVFALMNWNPEYRYKLLGKLIKSGDNHLFVFDLKTPEIFMRKTTNVGNVRNLRSPTYPEEWKNQFGLPVDEHKGLIQVNIFDKHVVFGLEKISKKLSLQEDKAYEQLKLEISAISAQNDPSDNGGGS